MTTLNLKTPVMLTGGAAAIGQKVYLPGGLKDVANNILHDRMQTYNNGNNKWSQDAELLPVVADGTAAGWSEAAICADAQNKTVYVVNGVDGASIYAATQIYDTTAPAGSRWSYGPLPTYNDGTNDVTFFSQDSGCAVIQGKLYLFGGYGAIDPRDTQGKLLKDTWVLDIATGVWSDTTRPMKFASLWFGYTASNSQAWVAGGTNDLVNNIPIAKTQRFSPATGWSGRHDLPAGLLGPGMGMYKPPTGASVPAVFGGGEWDPVGMQFLLHQDTITCSGGCSASGAGWVDIVLDLVTHRWFMGFASGGGKLYAAGGQGVPGLLLDAEKSS